MKKLINMDACCSNYSGYFRQKMIRNSSYKAYHWFLLAVAMIIITQISMVSAWDLGIDNRIDVSPDKTVVTYIDTAIFGEDTTLAVIELRTELNQQVGLGYQKVFEYEIRNTYEDVDKMVGDLNFYNVKDGMKPIEVDVDLKYKIITNEKGTNKVCTADNKTNVSICEDVPYDRNIISYDDYTPKTILKDEVITISGWTNVKQRDKIEWEQKFYDDKLYITKDIWATWSGNLSEGLVGYYKLDETSGTNVENIANPLQNATASSVYLLNQTTTGKINSAYNGTSNTFTKNRIDIGVTDVNTNLAFAYGGWFWKNGSVGSVPWGQGYYGLAASTVVDIDTFGTGASFRCKYVNTSNSEQTISSAYNTNYTWVHIVCTYDGAGNTGMWVNGVNVGNSTFDGRDKSASTTHWVIGSQYTDASSAQYWTGGIDEVFLYNRTLTGDEIGYLYNSGDGCQYGDEDCFFSDNPPTSTLNAPTEAQILTSTTVQFNCTGVDDSLLQNVSLIINGSYNVTNATVSNNTIVTNTVVLNEGAWNWSCEACDNSSQCTNATTGNFTVALGVPVVSLITPIDTFNSSADVDDFLFNFSLDSIDWINYTFNVWNETEIVRSRFVVNQTPDADCTETIIGDTIEVECIGQAIDENSSYEWNALVCADNGKCVTQGANFTFTIDNIIPQIEIVHPTATNYTNNASQLVNISVTDEHTDTIYYDWEGSNETYSTAVNVTFAQGYNTLTVWANDTFGNSNQTDVTFYVDNFTTTVTLNSPVTMANLTDGNVVFNCTGSDNLNLWNVSLIINGTYNNTNLTVVNNTPVINTVPLADGFYNWTCEACDWTGLCANATTGNFSIDTIDPVITNFYPDTSVDYHEENTNITLNFTMTDTNLDSCWYDLGGVNYTLDCADNSSLNITDYNINNITYWANDTFGNTNLLYNSWSYRLLETNYVYISPVTEGSSNYFYGTFTTNGSVITLAKLNYNGTNYTSSISSSGDTYNISKIFTAPQVATDTNLSFYWTITNNEGFTYFTSDLNQTVINFGIDNCSSYSYPIYNFTQYDEETQVEINESTTYINATINLQLYVFGTTTQVVNYSTSFNGVNPYSICLENNLSGGGQYNIDLELQYDAEGYAPEFYHIQNDTISSADINTNLISLYDLNDSDSQVFELLVRDTAYLPLSNALVYVDRKYIEEGVFKTVEIPLTDNTGKTIAHLVPEDVIYNFRIVKNGVTITTFNNVIAVCQTPTIDDCTIDFNAFASGLIVPDYEEGADFNYTLGFDDTTRVISSVFTIPSNTAATVILNVTKTDALGTSVCTDTLTSSSGTLSCIVPASIGNSTVLAKLTKDGNFQAQGTLKLDQTPSDIYGGILVFLGMFLMVTLIGAGISDNPVFTIIFFMVGVIALFALNLVVNNGFIGGTATILWLIIAIILVLIKGARRT